jgi:hypothetical protein
MDAKTPKKARFVVNLKEHNHRKLLLFFTAGFLSSDLRFRALHVQIYIGGGVMIIFVPGSGITSKISRTG